MSNQFLEAALAYAAAGYEVFPCQSGGKAPATAHGLLDATNDEAQIRSWWGDGEDYNIGLVTGNGLVVFDFDKKSGGLDTHREMFEAKLLSATHTVHTAGGGLHLYYSSDDKTIRSRTGVKPGLDIRANGGYVIVPPSVNERGNPYTSDTDPINPLPSGLKDLLEERRQPLSREAGETDVIEGGRNDYLTRIAGVLRRYNLPAEAVAATLHSTNETVCNPPLPDNEVDRIVESVGRYESEKQLAPNQLMVPAADYFSGSVEFLNNKLEMAGESTGIEGLDMMLGGGLRKGELTVLHAEAKTGKNILLHLIIRNLLARGIKVAYASRELSPESEVIPQIASQANGINLYEKEFVDRSMVQLPLFKTLYFAKGYGHLSIRDLEAWIEQCQSHGIEYFFLDHLHYMLANSEDYAEAAEMARLLKTKTKEANLSINMIIQPTKIIEGVTLGKNTLRGGAGIGQALDNLLTMQRIMERDDNGSMRKTNISKLTLTDKRFTLAKEGSIYLEYSPKTMRLTEVEETTEMTVEPREHNPFRVL